MDFLPNDILCQIMLEMEAQVLQEFCRSSRKAHESIVNNEYFWQQKYIRDFPGEIRVKASSYKEAYELRNVSKLKLPWTALKAQKADQRFVFISVPTGKFRLIAGIHTQWNRDSAWIYNIEYRICGLPLDVINALRRAHVPDESITKIIQTSLNVNNITTEPFFTMFRKDLDKYEKSKLEKFHKYITDVIQRFE